MSDRITLDIDGAEAHVLEAALALYRAKLDELRVLGGDALEAAVTMDRPARRVQDKVLDALYPDVDADTPVTFLGSVG